MKIIRPIAMNVYIHNIVKFGFTMALSFQAYAQTNVLSTGHTDLALDYDGGTGAWNLHVGSDTFGTGYAASNVVLRVAAAAKTTIPAGFDFLGNAGDPIWILPQNQNENLLYLGYGGDGIPEGTFAGDRVTVTLKSMAGPGDFFSYATDSFGNPRVYFDTRDGISTNDAVSVQAGGDAHLDWGFTTPGTYTVAIEAAGILAASGATASSGPVAFTFQVDRGEVDLTNEHVDLRAIYDATRTNALSLVARDEDHMQNYNSNEVHLVVEESAKLSLPGGTPFGNAGDPLWIIPQSQNPDLLYLGLSTEGIPDNVFAGGLIWRLLSVQGPGNLFIWQSDSQGNLLVSFNSADGINSSDSHNSIVGSHEHFNWGFSTNGVYQVTFQVSGQRLEDARAIFSPPATFTFQVLPLPATNSLQLLSPHFLADGSFSFDLSGAASKSCIVQSTGNFSSWVTLTNVTPVASPETVIIPASPSQASRFFRVLAK